MGWLNRDEAAKVLGVIPDGVCKIKGLRRQRGKRTQKGGKIPWLYDAASVTERAKRIKNRGAKGKPKKTSAQKKIDAANKYLVEITSTGRELGQVVDAFADKLKANDPTIQTVTVHVTRVEEYSR